MVLDLPRALLIKPPDNARDLPAGEPELVMQGKADPDPPAPRRRGLLPGARSKRAPSTRSWPITETSCSKTRTSPTCSPRGRAAPRSRPRSVCSVMVLQALEGLSDRDAIRAAADPHRLEGRLRARPRRSGLRLHRPHLLAHPAAPLGAPPADLRRGPHRRRGDRRALGKAPPGPRLDHPRRRRRHPGHRHPAHLGDPQGAPGGARGGPGLRFRPRATKAASRSSSGPTPCAETSSSPGSCTTPRRCSPPPQAEPFGRDRRRGDRPPRPHRRPGRRARRERRHLEDRPQGRQGPGHLDGRRRGPPRAQVDCRAHRRLQGAPRPPSPTPGSSPP